MKDYDEIDPEQHERMYELIPRENYMKEHWHPLIETYIQKYCKDKDVLDLGCGYGRYTTTIKECTDAFLGLDLSKRWLNSIKNKKEISNIIRADAHNIPLKDLSFDVIVTIGLFEYVNREIVIKEISRVLKSKGFCVISVPNKYSAFRMMGKLISKIFRAEYYANEPSKKEMLKLFKDNDFRVIECKINDGLIWLPDFLDRFCGKKIYQYIEKKSELLGHFPFSNNMLFVIKRR